VSHGGAGGDGVRIPDVRPDVRSAAGRLGNAIRGTLSNRSVRLTASAFHPSPRCDALRGPAEGPYGPRLLVFPVVPGSLRCGPVSHVDRAGWIVEADGALEHSLRPSQLQEVTRQDGRGGVEAGLVPNGGMADQVVLSRLRAPSGPSLPRGARA